MGDERDFTSAMAKEALLKDKDEKCCGNCCWFCHEDTDGWGFCNTPAKLPEHVNRWFTNCEMPGGTDCGFVSRQEMRHHMVVLLQASIFYEQGAQKRYLVGANEFKSAIKFGYKYMKAFSKL